MTMTPQKIAGLLENCENGIARITREDLVSLLALAERALEPQGQALPVATVVQYHAKRGPKSVTYSQRDIDALPHGTKLYASQLALPAGRIPTDAMVVRGAESLHDALKSEGIDIEFDDNGTEVQQRIAESVFVAMACASPVVALPAGPVPEGFVLVPMHLNADMRDVLSEEDWTWEDLLAAANAVTEEQYYAIQSGDGESPAVAQPVADENVQALVDALKGVIRVADRKTIEFDAAHAALAAMGHQ